MKTINQFRWMLLLVMLISLSSCGDASRAEPIPTAIPRPTSMLVGTLQINAIQELTLSTKATLQDFSLQDVQISGNVLLGRTMGDNTTPIVISLSSGKLTVLNQPPKQSLQAQTVARYFSWVQPSSDGVQDELYLLDFASGEKQLLRDGRWPDVFENKVVWSEFCGTTSWDIYMYATDTQHTTPVITRDNAQIYPKVEQDWVAFAEIVNATQNTTHLYLYNILTGEEILLGRLPAYTLDCDSCTYNLNNRRVVWLGWDDVDETTASPLLYVYDLDTNNHRAIDVSEGVCAPRGFSMSYNLLKWGCTAQTMAGYDLEQDVFFEYPVLPVDISSSGVTTYLSDEWLVWQVYEKVSDPQNSNTRKLRLFVASITRQ